MFVRLSSRLLLLALLLAAPPAARTEGHGVTVAQAGNKRLEGIHALSDSDAAEMGLDTDSGPYVLLTEFFFGGVNVLDTKTTEITNVVPSAGFQERGGLGVFYAHKHIIVVSAGPLLGNPFAVYVYDPASADQPVATCEPDNSIEPGFFNDLEVVGDVAYVTDSTHNRLWSFNVPDAIENGSCDDLTFVELDAGVFLGEGDTPVRSNGIVKYGDGFLIALFQTHGLYYVEPENDISEEIVPLGDLMLPDGLELFTEDDGNQTLYVTQGINQISVFDVTMKEEGNATIPEVTMLGTLTADEYDTAATSAVVGDTLWTANLGTADAIPEAAENDTATFDYNFTVVGLSRFVNPEATPSPTFVDPEATPSPTSAPIDSGVAPRGGMSGVATALAGLVIIAGSALFV